MAEFSSNEVIEMTLNYILENQDECKTENGTYFVSKEKICDLMEKYLKDEPWYNFRIKLQSEEAANWEAARRANECYDELENNKSYIVTKEGIEIIKPLKKAIRENNRKILAEYIKDNSLNIVGCAVLLGIVGGIVAVPINVTNKRDKEWQRYENAKFVTDLCQYNLSDIYVVYDVNNAYFCTRKLEKITEEDSINGNFDLGTGSVGEYYYRDDIYGYYEVNTGNKMCMDHEDGFYIEKLTDFYDVDDMKIRDYSISISEVENEINNEFLLSRTPKMKRK
ncbi:MAG: hypothetical protein IK137_02770 [Bacilli bacterium]|nr:hypothetical protein [Bacilli bacterium]